MSYDALGRACASAETVGTGSAYSFSYAYNKVGGMLSETYPSSRVVSTTYDAVNRPVSVASGTINYVSNIQYTSLSAISQLHLGNGLFETTGYNGRLQPTSISLGPNPGSSTAAGFNLYYCPANGASCSTNNGNLMSQAIQPLNTTDAYTYDKVNRVGSAAEGAVWTQNYGYDNFANRWLASYSGLPTPTLETPVAQSWYLSNNRINGWGYDGAGNVTQVASMQRSFSYDAENRQVTGTINGQTANYTYDGEGRRVSRLVNGVTTVYAYDAMGQLAAEYASAPPAPPPCVTCYLTADHLGSTRVLTDGSGTVVARHDYLPFGEEIVSSNRTAALFYTSDNLAQKFTGKERDAETGLDFFGARYMSSAQGRFTSPDPKQMTGRHLMNPQKWNKYVYVQNNPLTSIDPDGLDDYKIFITDSRGGGGNWAGAKSAAEANGHTMQFYRGAAATTKNYNAAVSDPNSRVVFVGHTSHDPNTLKTTAVTLGDMGRSAGANSVQSVLGPPDASGVRNAEEVALPTTTVSANTIALFGCQSIDLASQYPGTNFIGMDSGTGQPGEAPVSSLQAMGAAAAAFVTADAAARPANGQPSANATDPVTAANQAFQQNKRKEDLDGDKVRRP